VLTNVAMSRSLKRRQKFHCVETRGELKGYFSHLKTNVLALGQSPGVSKVCRNFIAWN